MRALFADTSFYIALLSSDDAWHERAVEESKQCSFPVFTTEYVLLELGNHVRTISRNSFISLMDILRGDPNTIIIPSSAEAFEGGLSLYAERSDKSWSLTDCISFVVMRTHDISDALTCDHHFVQAGFRVLLEK